MSRTKKPRAIRFSDTATCCAAGILILLSGSLGIGGLAGAADAIARAGSSGPLATWTIPRANSGATGAVESSLPERLEVLWETKTVEAIETTPVCDGRLVFVVDVMGGMEALTLSGGESVWRKNFDTGFVASPALFLPDSLKPNSASTVAAIPVIRPDSSSPAVPVDSSLSVDPLLVVGDVEGNVYAIDPADGTTRWTYETDGEINSSPTFFAWPVPANASEAEKETAGESDSGFQIRVLQTSQDGNLYCFIAHTGELVWKYETGDQIRCAASIAEGQTFLGGCDGGLHVVDLSTGKAAREPLPLGGPTGSTPAMIRDEVFVPIMDGVVFAFNSKSGETIWKYDDPERQQDYRGDAAIGADRIVVASRMKHVDAIDRKTGQRIWRTTLRRRADASPLIVGDDVWIAGSDGRLMRLSLEDGSEKWSYEIRGAFFAAPAIVGDRLIIADDEGVVRCFGPP